MRTHVIAAALAGFVTLAACSTDSAKTADTAALSVDTSTAMASPTASETAVHSPGNATMSGGMLDPNSASAADLAAIPGVTAEIAGALTAARPFTNMVAVDKVLAKSLTEQQRDTVYTRLWSPIDLNKASAEEILLIPGVGPRMRHEFEEYRPYSSIEQFRREIGKYVDRTEVARLERYVAIR